MVADSGIEKDEIKWLMSQVQYYLEKIIEARREDMQEIEKSGKEFSDKLTRERNIIISVAAFIIAAIIPILYEFSEKQTFLIYILFIVLLIAGILFILLSVVKNKILTAFFIIRAAYVVPFAKLAVYTG